MIEFNKGDKVLKWWRTFTLEEQKILVKKYFNDFNFLLLSGIKIEEIFDNEIKLKEQTNL